MCFPKESNEILDRISWLPDHIIHQILACLPLEDLARTSILSKTWKGVFNSYPTVPVLCLDHNEFGLHFLLEAGKTGKEPDTDEIREKFIKFVDYRLSSANHQQLLVGKLVLNVAINDIKCFSHVDRLLDLVNKVKKVEELCLFVQTNDSEKNWENEIDSDDVLYNIPLFVLASRGLRSLYARGCKFAGLVNNTLVPFSSLQHLCLSRCQLDENAIINLARYCPWIEFLELKDCRFLGLLVENLKLSDFQRLKKVYVLERWGWLEEIDFEGTALEKIKCDATMFLRCNFTASACASVKQLSLSKWCRVMQPNLFFYLTNTFPLLEDAVFTIQVQVSETFSAANDYLRRLSLSLPNYEVTYVSHVPGFVRVKEIRIDCPNLEWFKFSGYGRKEVYINCPNLQKFCFAGDVIPVFPLFNPSAGIKDIYFQLGRICSFDDSWFIQLRGLIEQMAEAGRVIHLHLVCGLKMVEFVPKEFGAIEASQQNNVHLELSLIVEDGMNSAALVDGLMWSTRPTTLILKGGCSPFYKDLFEKLDKKARGETCDKESCNKCWWHHLQGFEVESCFRDVNGTFDMEAFLRMKYIRYPSSYFTFNWSSSLTLPPSMQAVFLRDSCIEVEKTEGFFHCNRWDGSGGWDL